MATYAKEKGFTVQTLSTDPVATQAEAGTWASGGNMNTARYAGAGSGGTSGIKFGGSTPSNTTATEEFTAADFQIKSVTTS